VILLSISVQRELREILQWNTTPNGRQVKVAIDVFDSVATDVSCRMISGLIDFRRTPDLSQSLMAAAVKLPATPAP
jgi:hypothetical protein